MRIDLTKKIECSGCGACASVCAKGCIDVVKDELGFSHAQFSDISSCVDCGRCINVCPQKHPRVNHLECKSIYYGKSTNRNNVINSTSGGVFSIIAEYIIEHGGVVWGVAMTDKGQATYICVDSLDELHKIRGSKYVEIGEPIPLKTIKKQLEDGIVVLASGTPCQMLALIKYMGKPYSNLYTLDLFCYGVQSPYMWSKYLNEVNNKRKTISHINFRCKDKSWWDYSMLINYTDNSKYVASRWRDPWLLSYAKSLYNRESCSKCEAKKFPKDTDFTLGDFWAIEWYLSRNPCIEKKEGVSIMFLHTSKAQRIFDRIRDKFILSELSVDNTIKLYPKLGFSNTINKDRENFIKLVKQTGFKKAVYTMLPHGITYKYKLLYKKNVVLMKLKIKKILKLHNR